MNKRKRLKKGTSSEVIEKMPEGILRGRSSVRIFRHFLYGLLPREKPAIMKVK